MVREQNAGGVDELDRDGAAIGDAGLALDQLGTAEISGRASAGAGRRAAAGGGQARPSSLALRHGSDPRLDTVSVIRTSEGAGWSPPFARRRCW
jgi:hypothetical protein